MKHLFFSLLCCLTLLAAFIPTQAQNNPVAMLEHAGTIKNYDGINSFRNAYADAVEGDVIVLSGGNFLAPDTINKKHVNIRGNGGRQHKTDSNPNPTNPTMISAKNNIYFWVDSIYVEGVSFLNTFHNYARFSSFVKCIFANDYYSYVGNYVNNNNVYINCRFSKYYDDGFSDGVTGNNYMNCIFDIYSSSDSYGSGNYYNCMFGNGSVTLNSKTFYDNCIFAGNYGNSTSYHFKSNQCRYCLLLNTNSYNYRSNFNSSYSNTNKAIGLPNFSDFFKDFTGSNYKIPTEYILTDSIAGIYLGPDGTQIGVHGGNYPFEYEVSASHVVYMNVKPNVNNGKLTVTVKMSTDAADTRDDEDDDVVE